MTKLLSLRGSNTPTCMADQPRRMQYFSLRAVPALIVMRIGFAAPPAYPGEILADASSPVVDIILVAAPGIGVIFGLAASPSGKEVYVAD
ncbi:MAG: hypothetical protein JO170_09685 [Verrucomicrobia bacterium]|nr:hypothetical protein [Verrucomicrobiota bacterium]